MSSKNLIARASSHALGRVFFFSIALFAILVQAPTGRCDLVLGNMAGGFNDAGLQATFGSSDGYSIGFTVGATPITITSVDLRLRTQSGSVPANPGVATLELRSDASGNPSSSALASFGNQNVGIGFSTVNFTPTGAMQLAAGTKYWFTIGTQVPSSDLMVIGSNDTPIAPIGPFATFAGLRYGTFGSQTLDPTQAPPPFNAFIPTFAINGTITAVPEPSSFIPFAIGYGIFEWYRRRSKRSRSLGA